MTRAPFHPLLLGVLLGQPFEVGQDSGVACPVTTQLDEAEG